MVTRNKVNKTIDKTNKDDPIYSLHDSLHKHVSGKSIFTGDLPKRQGELIVDFLPSKLAHGKIINIDLTPAQNLPGIVALYTAQNVEGQNTFGPIFHDQPFLADKKVNYIGEPIVLIAGESREIVSLAKKKIKITIKPQTPILSVKQAIKAKAYIKKHTPIITGDPQKVFKQANSNGKGLQILKGSLSIGGQNHFYLESQTAVAYPEEDECVKIYSSTQNPTEVQHIVARVLGIKQNQVICTVKRLGGGFGGKESQASHFATMAAMVALKTGRPARIELSVDDDMCFTGKRHRYEVNYKAAYKNNGNIEALKIDFFSDGGSYADLSTAIMERTLLHTDNAYFIPHIIINGTICKTNFPPNTAFRGFGAPQGVVAIENIMEEISQQLKIDSLKVRKINLYGIRKNNITPYGQTVQNNKLHDLLSSLPLTSDYQNRLNQINKFNSGSKTHLKGISLVPIKFGISFTSRFLNQGNALVNILLDGTIQVSTGAVEMGQGVNSKIRQLVADAFTIPTQNILIMPTSTEKNSNTSPTAASSGTDINGAAALDACNKIIARLKACFVAYHRLKTKTTSELEINLQESTTHIKLKNGELVNSSNTNQRISFYQLLSIAYQNRISLSDYGFYKIPVTGFDRNSAKGSPFLYYTQGAAISEIIIDRFTGISKILRADILMDLGKPLHQNIDQGQVEGAFIQALGWVTTEELVYGDQGNLLSHSPTTYKIPNIQDIPPCFNIDFIENSDSIISLKRSKAVGEPPFLLGISVWTAVKHALSFLSKSDKNPLSLPATPEVVFKIIQGIT